MSFAILGVRIDTLTKEEAIRRVREFLSSDTQHTVFTPNPEMLVYAQKDKEFLDILNAGSLNICDGKGIELVSKGKLKRIPGIDFMLEICRLAAEERKKIYLLGSLQENIVKMAKQTLEEQYPTIQIVGAETGGVIHSNGRTDDGTLFDRIRTATPEILFVGFGHGKQEKWIYKNLVKLPSIKIAMGVGGAFDVFGGKFPRAPRLLRAVGLEWLWRLYIEPRRVGRIWKATVEFTFIFFSKK